VESLPLYIQWKIVLTLVFVTFFVALEVLCLFAEFGHPSAEVEHLSLPIANVRIAQCS